MDYSNNKLNQRSNEAENQRQNFSGIPSQSSNRNLKIIIGVLIVLLIVAIGATSFYILKNKKSVPDNGQTTAENNQNVFPTFQNFATGRIVLYYNQDGIFQVDFKTQQKVQLVTFPFPVRSYGHPVLSPDNTKIVFYTGTADRYDLWLYDLKNKETRKLLTGLELNPAYIQTPVWAKTSKSVFITIIENGVNRLLQIDLSGRKSYVGQNYSGNALWPEIINGNFLAFKTALPEGNTVGIADLKNNKISLFDTPTNADFAEIEKINNNLFLKIGNPGLSSVGEIDKTKIFGLEKLDLLNSQVETIAIPAEVKIDSNFKRIQPIASCNRKVILGQVIIDNNKDNYLGESYNKFYILDIENNSVKALNISSKDQSVQSFGGIHCDANPNVSKAYFQNDFQKTEPISITAIDLLNPENIQTISYSSLLTQNIKEKINNNCIYPIVKTVSNNNNNDFIYVNLSQSHIRAYPNKCKPDEISPVAGIYRLSKKESSISKKVDEGENFLIIPSF